VSYAPDTFYRPVNQQQYAPKFEPSERVFSDRPLGYLDGCDVHPACLSCPLPVCRYDHPAGLAGAKVIQRNIEIRRLAAEGLTNRQIMARLNLRPGTVQRVLREDSWLRVRSVVPIFDDGLSPFVDVLGLRVLRPRARIVAAILLDAERWGVPYPVLKGRDRDKHVAAVRHTVMRRLIEEAELQATEIAFLLKRDHSSVLHGVKMARGVGRSRVKATVAA
jgi:hypothetical protein